MSKTVLSQVSGFTPVIDSLAQKYGLMTAAVFGRIWRYCQGDRGVCQATLDRIGADLGIDKASVMRHAKKLVEEGYLEDVTPDLRNKPHTYRDTGKAGLSITVSATDRAVQGSTLQPATPPEPTLQSATSDSTVQRHVAESHLKRGFKKEERLSPAGAGDEEAGQLEPVLVNVPTGMNKAKASEYTEKCPHCQERLTQEKDECPGCGTQVIWTNSPLANAREKKKRNQITDARAKANRTAAAGKLPDGARQLLLKAITVDFSGDVSFKQGEAERVAAFATQYGVKALEEKMAEVLADNPDIAGRGLITIVLRKLGYHGMERSGKRRDGDIGDVSDDELNMKVVR